MSQFRKVKMKTLYHTTRRINRESILEKGLLAVSRDGTLLKYPPRVYLTKVKDDIHTMDFLNQWDDIDIWKVKVDEKLIFPDRFSHLPFHYYVNESIPVENIKLAKHLPLQIITDKMREDFNNSIPEGTIMIKWTPNLLDRIKGLFGIEWRFIKGRD